jgi:glycosyltransferase involved in cell wall biosynthesis
MLALIEEFDGPVFASTPDQLAYLPERSRWLPVVVDTAGFAAGSTRPPFEGGVPLFVHAPSNPALKGTAHVERVLRPLADRGLIELRMVTGLPPEQAAELIRAADVVVDQLLLGLYGVLAGEAMASGRVVLGHLGDSLRALVDHPIPVIEADPRTLQDVVERLLDDPDAARKVAAQGPGFVAAVHDGRRSAQVLAPFVGPR